MDGALCNFCTALHCNLRQSNAFNNQANARDTESHFNSTVFDFLDFSKSINCDVSNSMGV